MKKVILSLSLVCLAAGATIAQEKKTTVQNPAAATPASGTLSVNNMEFKADNHDFGDVQEGPAADYEFQFKNTGKEPLIIQHVQASCGCTTPSYTKEPIAPGKTGTIKASYNTSGRPGQFTKTLTVTSNAGVKVLTIKGNVEKAPTTSVPENNSMMKTN
ncbi:DUF1573 domain-containing protein [Chitinophagaceae bacterium MMS25-I14]